MVRRARFELTTRPLSDVEHISDLHQRAVGSTVELPAPNFLHTHVFVTTCVLPMLANITTGIVAVVNPIHQ